jgi:hypothetical protein
MHSTVATTLIARRDDQSYQQHKRTVKLCTSKHRLLPRTQLHATKVGRGML